MVIRDEAEDAALRIHGGLVVERAVFEVKAEMRRYTIAVHHLDKVATSENLTLLCGQREEAVQCPFGMTHGNRLRGGNERDGTSQHGNVSPASNS